MSTMQMTEGAVERVPVVSITGVIDRETCLRLRGFLARKLARKTPGLVLDLGEVTGVDACGIATLIEYRRGARAFGGELVLVGLRPRVRAALEIMRVREIILVREDVAARVEAVGFSRGVEEVAGVRGSRAWGRVWLKGCRRWR